MLSNYEKDLIKKESLNPFHKKEYREGITPYTFPNCSDNIQIFITKNPDTEKYDIYFYGEGCSLSQASTSLMIRETNNKTKKEINSLIENVKKILREGDIIEIPESLSFIKEFYQKPNRRQCIELGWLALEKELEKIV